MVALLLDAYNLLYRAFTSLPRTITDDEGQPVHALYGMLAYMVRLASDFESTTLVAAFDTPEIPTFRRELFPAYQAQRGPMGGEHAEDFSRQATLAQSVLPRLGVPAVHVPRFEADDIMGTIATIRARRGDASIIVSTDRDLLQLVGSSIRVLSPGNPPRIATNDADVRGRLGVDPAGVATFKALAGDASDNIPGVRGIGSKTAAALVNTFGSLEEIYAGLDGVKPRVREALAASGPEAYLYRDIATVRVDLPLELDTASLPDCEFPSNAKPRQLLRQAGLE